MDSFLLIMLHQVTRQKMEEHPDLNSLMEDFQLSEEDCKLQVTDIYLEKISSTSCEKWRSLPPYLKMEKIVTKDIDREHQGNDESEKRHTFFKKWKKTKGLKATYRSLINALLETKCREDAERVCELLKKHASSLVQQLAVETSGPQEASGHEGMLHAR